MKGVCIQCGAQAEDGHHPTGRGSDLAYLDPWLKIAHCHSDHELAHDDLRSADLEDPSPGNSFLEELELGLRRLGVFLGRLPSAVALGDLLAMLARWCVTKADCLRGVIAALDAGNPGWRSLPGMP